MQNSGIAITIAEMNHSAQLSILIWLPSKRASIIDFITASSRPAFVAPLCNADKAIAIKCRTIAIIMYGTSGFILLKVYFIARPLFSSSEILSESLILSKCLYVK